MEVLAASPGRGRVEIVRVGVEARVGARAAIAGQGQGYRHRPTTHRQHSTTSDIATYIHHTDDRHIHTHTHRHTHTSGVLLKRGVSTMVNVM